VSMTCRPSSAGETRQSQHERKSVDPTRSLLNGAELGKIAGHVYLCEYDLPPCSVLSSNRTHDRESGAPCVILVVLAALPKVDSRLTKAIERYL
jgi:hypothetical protein